jgi:hypothetical protein
MVTAVDLVYFGSCFPIRQVGRVRLLCAYKDFRNKTFFVFRFVHEFVIGFLFCFWSFWHDYNILRKEVNFWEFYWAGIRAGFSKQIWMNFYCVICFWNGD